MKTSSPFQTARCKATAQTRRPRGEGNDVTLRSDVEGRDPP